MVRRVDTTGIQPSAHTQLNSLVRGQRNRTLAKKTAEVASKTLQNRSHPNRKMPPRKYKQQ